MTDADPIAASRNRSMAIGDLKANELHPAAESALREWPIDRRINRSGDGDDDPMTMEALESGLL
jgi:hypothetical protein